MQTVNITSKSAGLYETVTYDNGMCKKRALLLKQDKSI